MVPRVLLSWITFLWLCCSSYTNANVSCENDAICEERLRPGSVCVDGTCSNPFQQGCLRTILGEENFPNQRTCNSHDLLNSTDCRMSPLDYTEIRVSPNNWESAMFYGWILQVLLSELAEVPVSIDTGRKSDGTYGGVLNFYDSMNGFAYPKTVNDYEALYVANDVTDCRLTDEPCAHVLPEVWQGKRAVDEAKIERDGNGMVGHVGYYVPRFVVQADETLASHWGIRGIKNRQKLANTFKRPTTFMDFCNEVSESNCTEVDGNATRYPTDETEGAKYYVKGIYNGHFRATEKNDCSDGKNCTGALIDYPCTWAAYTESQLFWNNVALESKRYTYSSILQIMDASIATRSPAMFIWWYPDASLDKYDLLNVPFPEATRECLENRPKIDSGLVSRCDATFEQLIGQEIGSCGYNTHSFEKWYNSDLREDVLNVPIARRSPAYAMLRNIRISDIDLSEMLDDWTSRGIDKSNYDPREAVCTWVAKNLDDLVTLRKFLPKAYPREIVPEQGYKGGGSIAAIIMATFVAILVLATAAGVYVYRTSKIIRYAQEQFLYMYCAGYLLICIGAILFALTPTNFTCMTRIWLVSLGFVLSLVPLLVRVSAINKLMMQAKKCKRVQISQNSLYYTVAGVCFLVIVYLATFTAVDPLVRKKDYDLRDESGNVVDATIQCSSDYEFWHYIEFTWEACLILISAVLAFQSRNVRQEFNESSTIAKMAYVHFLFFAFRTMIIFIPPKAIKESSRYIVSSALLSLDALMSLVVYNAPKFYAIYRRDQNASTTAISSVATGWGASSANYSSNYESGQGFQTQNNTTSNSYTTTPSVTDFTSRSNASNHSRAVSFKGDDGQPTTTTTTATAPMTSGVMPPIEADTSEEETTELSVVPVKKDGDMVPTDGSSSSDASKKEVTGEIAEVEGATVPPTDDDDARSSVVSSRRSTSSEEVWAANADADVNAEADNDKDSKFKR